MLKDLPYAPGSSQCSNTDKKKELKVTPKGKTLRTVIKKAPGKKIVRRRKNKIKKLKRSSPPI